jgi:hypothetical protein
MTLPVPIGGLIGWRYLERSMDRQLAFAASEPSAARQLRHLREALPQVHSVDDLLNDRQLTQTVLSAFGLESEIGKSALLRRILAEGATDPDAFARRMSDKRFENIARVLAFDDAEGPHTTRASVVNKIAGDFIARRVENAAGETDPALRLALNFKREIASIAGGSSAKQAGWYQIMGNTPLRQVIEGAFGLPSDTAKLDLEDQRRLFEKKARSLFGEESPVAFLNPANVTKVIERYIVRNTALNPVTSPVLQLFQGTSSVSPVSLLLARASG